MGSESRQGAREALAAQRAEALHRLGVLRTAYDGIVDASRDSNADDEHDPEGATIAYERSQLDALVQQAEQTLGEVDAALDRLAAGTYGTCERCGSRIAPGRLEARPLARTCVPCAASPPR